MSFEHKAIVVADKPGLYRELLAQAEALFAGEPDAVANAANLAALIYHNLPQLNWAGFYFHDRAYAQGDDGAGLVLGPFQGKVACVRISMGRGVCGTAAARGETVVVPDVHQFPGHIACDADSRSEIVVPLLLGERLLGVLDLDSPVTDRFDGEDRAGLEALAAAWVRASRHR